MRTEAQAAKQAMTMPKRRKVNSYALRNTMIPWLFVIPGILFTLWLRYYPLLKAFYISLFDYSVVEPPGKFIGLKNFTDILNQSAYWSAWKNTFIFLILTLIITFAIPVIQAIFLSEVRRSRSFLSTIYLVAAVVPISVTVILWKWIWQPDYGVANGILSFFHLPHQLWLSDPFWTKFCIVLPGILGGGVTVLIYLAAILGIPGEVVEAAKMDGCSGWRKLYYIVLPNISSVIYLFFVMGVIGCMQLMVTPFQYTSGGPAGTSTPMGLYVYNTFMKEGEIGRSNAASVLLFIVVAVMTAIQMKFDKSESG
ncbi:carbohydrate ABC transporter permease [Paenibacillus sp. OV219]|uniref:carbohydrate ABC transporter permease n=1 Tax=Paenibacillus sp. OV219 TaxID=1884377 RepID=UPI0008B31E36|nr:sugar ABC transporter permease [Paenibacillus sp. OV219]SEO04892.1 carbohydrate ABC transporter membrane protein 1, CUT1 family [Paenibacillus sp. OV219]